MSVNLLRWSLKQFQNTLVFEKLSVNLLRWSLKQNIQSNGYLLNRCKFTPLEFETVLDFDDSGDILSVNLLRWSLKLGCAQTK